MDETNVAVGRYQVPTYVLEPHEAFFHFLHGNVPGHQIDFMYRPWVPQPPLTRQHFSHLERVLKYIEPRQASAYSFAITNLSRDDNQHEPGHGGVAFVFGLRIRGATDHVGRQDPPFSHSAALVDRHLDANTIYGIASQFYKKLLPDEESQVEGSGWYHQYVLHAQHSGTVEPVLKAYLNDFADLYVPAPSKQKFRWTVDGATVPRRVTIVYPDRADFATIAFGMARIAEVLIESNVKWTAVSNGREQDVVGGLTVRFVPRREALDAAPDEVLLYLEHLSENPAEIAFLFNAHEVQENPRASRLPPPPPMALRANGAAEHAPFNGIAQTNETEQPQHTSAVDPERPWAKPHVEEVVEQEDPAIRTQGLGIIAVVEKNDGTESQNPATDWAAEFKKNERKQRKQTAMALIATAMFIVVFGALALIWFGSEPTPPEAATEPSTSAPAKTAPAAPRPQVTNSTDVAGPSESASAAPGDSVNGMALPAGTIQVKVPTKAKTKEPKKKTSVYD